jgi:hypothetical protein
MKGVPICSDDCKYGKMKGVPLVEVPEWFD